jgi:hypothetical protein
MLSGAKLRRARTAPTTTTSAPIAKGDTSPRAMHALRNNKLVRRLEKNALPGKTEGEHVRTRGLSSRWEGKEKRKKTKR